MKNYRALTVVQNRLLSKFLTGLFVLSALTLAGISFAKAADISDAASCDAAVANSEKSIIRATLSADDLNTLVSLADQAKAACGSEDFAKAAKITDAIDAKIASVTTN